MPLPSCFISNIAPPSACCNRRIRSASSTPALINTPLASEPVPVFNNCATHPSFLTAERCNGDEGLAVPIPTFSLESIVIAVAVSYTHLTLPTN